MSTFISDEIHDVPHELTVVDSGSGFDSPDFDYEFSVAGIKWLSAASDQYPYQRQLTKVLRDQLDTSEEPGDNSLEGWWTRHQTDFSGGEGQIHMEPATNELVRRMYYEGHNVDPFTVPGMVSLLPAAVETFHSQLSQGNDPTIAKLADHSYIVGFDNSIHYSSSASSITFPDHVRSILVAGDKVLVALNDNTIVILSAAKSVVGEIDHKAIPGLPMMRWVKGRVILGVADKLFELVDLTAGMTLVDSIPSGSTRDQTMPIVNMRDTTWQFSGACSTPKSILVSGYGAAGSTIQALIIDDKGALPDISAPIEVAQLPSNEMVIDLVAYLGTYVGIGTDKGLRIGTTSDGGGLVYGPLVGSPVPAQKVGTFSVFDRFLHYVDATGAFIKVDLSTADEDGRHAWAHFTEAPGALGGVVFGSRETVMLATSITTVGGVAQRNLSVLHFDDANGLAESGTLSTSWVRFNTLEKKFFDSVKVVCDPPMAGRVTVSVIDDESVQTEIGNLTSATGQEATLKVRAREGYTDMAVHFRLERSATDHTKGPILTAWSTRAWPAVEGRGETVVLPLLCFDFERDALGVQVGYEGYAADRWTALIETVRVGNAITVEETRSNFSYVGIVEDATFTQIAPGTNASGFGGIAQIVIRQS